MNDQSPQTLGERCLAARTKANLSQAEAAYRLRDLLPPGRKPDGSVIHKIEAGKTKEPAVEIVAGLAKVYGVHLRDLDPVMADEAAQMIIILTECAPWESNPEPADSRLCLI